MTRRAYPRQSNRRFAWQIVHSLLTSPRLDRYVGPHAEDTKRTVVALARGVGSEVTR